MSRMQTSETVAVAPSNNIYTVLAIAGTVAVAIGLIVLILKANALGIELFKM